MSFNCDDMTDEQLQELIALLNENIESHNDLVELTRWFPTPALFRLVGLIKRFKEAMEKIPIELWEDLIRFINCDLEAIRDKHKEDLLQLLDILESYLQIELSDPQVPNSEGQINEMLEVLRRARSAVETGDDANAVEELRKLKEKYRLEYAAIWTLIVSIYNLGLLDDLGRAGGNLLRPRIGQMIKKLIGKIIEKVLIRKLGEQGAKKLIPYVGVILTAVELIAYGATLAGIAAYKEAICKMLCCVLKQLEKRGYQWPLTNPYVYVSPSRLVTPEFPIWYVTYQNIIRCCYKTEEMGEEDCCEWGDRCVVRFEDGQTTKRFVVTNPPIPGPSGHVDPSSNTLYYPNDISDDSLDNSKCLNPEGGRKVVKCYTITRIEVTAVSITHPPQFKRSSKEIINGVKFF